MLKNVLFLKDGHREAKTCILPTSAMLGLLRSVGDLTRHKIISTRLGYALFKWPIHMFQLSDFLGGGRYHDDISYYCAAIQHIKVDIF